jgi:hypothetical protein
LEVEGVPGSAVYAKLAPAARVAKSLVPPPERLRDAMLAPDFKEALAALRDVVPGLAEARGPSDVGAALYSWLGSMAYHLARLAPERWRGALLAFALDDVALDMLVAMEASERGSRPSRLPTSVIEWAPTAILARDPELMASPERIVEAASGFKTLERSLRWALDSARQVRSARVYTLAHAAVSFKLYTEPLEGLDSYSLEYYKQVVCPMLRHRAARTAAQAALQGLEPRVATAAIPAWRDVYCRIPWRALRELVEREVEEEQVLAGLRQLMPDLGLEGRTLREAVEASHRATRARVGAAVFRAFASYPLHLGLAAAALAAARMAVESVRGILVASALRLRPDQYSEPLGIEA